MTLSCKRTAKRISFRVVENIFIAVCHRFFVSAAIDNVFHSKFRQRNRGQYYRWDVHVRSPFHNAPKNFFCFIFFRSHCFVFGNIAWICRQSAKEFISRLTVIIHNIPMRRIRHHPHDRSAPPFALQPSHIRPDYLSSPIRRCRRNTRRDGKFRHTIFEAIVASVAKGCHGIVGNFREEDATDECVAAGVGGSVIGHGGHSLALGCWCNNILFMYMLWVAGNRY
mmetsp:Transcript_26299/g.55148  ORF Transcript_26299/g.55148 Transcript_26299/m.55148 type:complete len:224 (-) Transcript_26299:18-689(-)